MAVFKSRQVNLDPKPYMGWSGQRYAADERTTEGYGDGSFKFDPRPEFEPTRDPFPWAYRHEDGTLGARTDENDEGWDWLVWAPRREQFDTPINPILAAAREYVRLGDTTQEAAKMFLHHDETKWASNATPEQINHARRVLTRLADWQENSHG